MADSVSENGDSLQPIFLEEDTPASSEGSGSVKLKKIERSCLMCHQRKIRCDKRSPCFNCVKVNLLCSYPGPERARRRPRKTTISDVAARVARLERTVTSISSEINQAVSNDQSMSLSVPSTTNEGMSETPSTSGISSDELLMNYGRSSRYINEFLLSRVLEEEQELKKLVGNTSCESNRPMKSPSFDIGGIFSGFNQSLKDTQHYQPSRLHAMQLWRTFVTNVDPVVKVLHIPTMQGIFFAAINKPDIIEDDLNALLFSIYFAATTSLTSIDAGHLLGQPKNASLKYYKQGLEQSLAGSNFLDKPTIRSLQALTIYITCLRAYNGGRASWTLNGLAIRSAQSIGLHRDGENLGLSPFESEMRRRLWWCMSTTDTRALEDHGIALNASDWNSDTHFPINLNDCDLSPDMKELPQEKARWTEMSLTLSMIDISQVLKKLYRTAISQGDSQSKESVGQILSNLKTRIATVYLNHCDLNVPIQKATMLCSSFLVAKVEFLIPLNGPSRYGPERNLSQATDESLMEACRILEMTLQLHLDDLMQGLNWYGATFKQYYLLTYVLWHLSAKPIGVHVDRAWDLVDRSFEMIDREDSTCDPGWRWTILQLLKDKAIRIRQSCTSDCFMTSIEGGDVASMKVMNEFGEGSDFTFGNEQSWAISDAEFPDWSNLDGKFDLYSFAWEN